MPRLRAMTILCKLIPTLIKLYYRSNKLKIHSNEVLSDTVTVPVPYRYHNIVGVVLLFMTEFGDWVSCLCTVRYRYLTEWYRMVFCFIPGCSTKMFPRNMKNATRNKQGTHKVPVKNPLWAL